METLRLVAQKFEQKARTGDVLIDEKTNFDSLLLASSVLDGLKSAGFERPSPIQLKAIPLGRCGLDLIVQAKSGTGKTCVFAVIALESIDVKHNCTQVVVLAPTREIANQIEEVINTIGRSMDGLRCHVFIGGLPVANDEQNLKRCHIAVATPGRFKQLIKKDAVNVNSVRLFVLDEADKLLEQGFQDDINWIYSSLPTNKQMLALSATYPESLAQQLTRYMRNPTMIRLNTCKQSLLGISQYYFLLPFRELSHKMLEEKFKFLLTLLSSIKFDQCLIFSNYQMRAQSLSDMLNEKNWRSAYISGSLDQESRLNIMAGVRNHEYLVLIATDLLSRGIDLEDVNLVVNLDVPADHETYLHRIGRAGRFGSYGAAVTLVCQGKEYADLKLIETKCQTTIRQLPDPVPEDLVRQRININVNGTNMDCADIDIIDLAVDLNQTQRLQHSECLGQEVLGYRHETSSSTVSSKHNFISCKIDSNSASEVTQESSPISTKPAANTSGNVNVIVAPDHTKCNSVDAAVDTKTMVEKKYSKNTSGELCCFLDSGINEISSKNNVECFSFNGVENNSSNTEHNLLIGAGSDRVSSGHTRTIVMGFGEITGYKASEKLDSKPYLKDVLPMIHERQNTVNMSLGSLLMNFNTFSSKYNGSNKLFEFMDHPCIKHEMKLQDEYIFEKVEHFLQFGKYELSQQLPCLGRLMVSLFNATETEKLVPESQNNHLSDQTSGLEKTPPDAIKSAFTNNMDAGSCKLITWSRQQLIDMEKLSYNMEIPANIQSIVNKLHLGRNNHKHNQGNGRTTTFCNPKNILEKNSANENYINKCDMTVPTLPSSTSSVQCEKNSHNIKSSIQVETDTREISEISVQAINEISVGSSVTKLNVTGAFANAIPNGTESQHFHEAILQRNYVPASMQQNISTGETKFFDRVNLSSNESTSDTISHLLPSVETESHKQRKFYNERLCSESGKGAKLSKKTNPHIIQDAYSSYYWNNYVMHLHQSQYYRQIHSSLFEQRRLQNIGLQQMLYIQTMVSFMKKAD